MASRETRLQHARRRGDAQVRSLVAELVHARVGGGLSQQALAGALGRSQSEVSRLERAARPSAITVLELGEVAALLGLELSIALHPRGDPIRDKGHQALINRFRKLLSAAWMVTAEAAFPNPGDRRTWDLLLRVRGQRVGVECETRIRDIQALTRRIHQRERDGGSDVTLLILNDSAVNRRLLPELRASLGPAFAHSPRPLFRALRDGQPLPGPGVLLV